MRSGLAVTLMISWLGLSAAGQCQEPEKVSLCLVKNDPASFNKKLIEITGFVSHGFEDFTLVDPKCPSWPAIWLEYGGKAKSGTVYCCGVGPERTRPDELVIEDVPIPLVDDARFRAFDALIERPSGSVVHATVVGRFFAGRENRFPRGTSSGGYGHMGCCSLLAIQQILSVDPHDREDLDYGASADQPEVNKVGCGFRDLTAIEPYDDSMQAQEAAERGERDWTFNDPERVAKDFLARLLKTDENSIRGLRRTRKVQGRVVYQWNRPAKQISYMIVVARPYWLSFYSTDSKRVAWIVLAAYESSCEKAIR